jgi:hypothetical protein
MAGGAGRQYLRSTGFEQCSGGAAGLIAVDDSSGHGDQVEAPTSGGSSSPSWS